MEGYCSDSGQANERQLHKRAESLDRPVDLIVILLLQSDIQRGCVLVNRDEVLCGLLTIEEVGLWHHPPIPARAFLFYKDGIPVD